MASMDGESRFMFVPVDETIDLISIHVYHSGEVILDIYESSLRLLLQTCTREVPFYNPGGYINVKHDGVAISLPLGILFANFSMVLE